MDAELRRVAEDRLELGGDRSFIGAGESGRGQSRRRRGGEKLNDQRKRDEDCGKRGSERRQAGLRASSPKRKCPGPEANQHSLRCPYSVAERMRERNFICAVDNAPAVGFEPARSLILFCSKRRVQKRQSFLRTKLNRVVTH
jgi:hypothetical protein